MKFKDLPKELMLEFCKNLCDAEEKFNSGFVGVYDSLEDWMKDCDFEGDIDDFLDIPLGSPVETDYIYHDEKYYCFCWA